MVSSVMGGSQGMAEANFSSGTQSGPSCPSPCRKAHSKRCASLTGRASIWGWTWPAAVQQLVDARRVLMPERELNRLQKRQHRAQPRQCALDAWRRAAQRRRVSFGRTMYCWHLRSCSTSHLQASLDAQATDLLHEQEDAVAARHYVVLQLAQLHRRKVLRGRAQSVLLFHIEPPACQCRSGPSLERLDGDRHKRRRALLLTAAATGAGSVGRQQRLPP